MKILIITYYWPPAGGPGVQRWLKFVKYLKGFGIEPTVYIPENPTYPLQDASLLSEIPENITVIKQPIFEPYQWASIFSKKETKTISSGIITSQKKQSWVQKLLLFIRGNFFIPDARKFWVQPSIKFLEEYLQNESINTIITTGPPHSIHLIGKGLKKKAGVKWIADFRDPWTTIGYHKKLKLTKKSKERHLKLEKEVLQQSDQIIVTSYTTQKEFEQITNQPIEVITNGYDNEDINRVSVDAKFTISHIGSLLSGRDPANLWKALFELTQEDTSFAEAFQLQLIGAVSDDVLSSIKSAGLNDFVVFKGYVTHQKAIQLQRSSQVLLLIEINEDETRCIIPGKLFEYMISGRPMLAFGPKEADIKKLIEETKSGSFFEYDQYEEIKEQLKSYFKNYKKGILVSESQNIEQYSRKHLTEKLAKVVKGMHLD